MQEQTGAAIMKAAGALNGNWKGGIYNGYTGEARFTASGEEMTRKELEDKIIFHLLEIKRANGYQKTVERCEARLKELKPQYEKEYGKGSYERFVADKTGVG